jgi:hypothetical protein
VLGRAPGAGNQVVMPFLPSIWHLYPGTERGRTGERGKGVDVDVDVLQVRAIQTRRHRYLLT